MSRDLDHTATWGQFVITGLLRADAKISRTPGR